MTQHSNTVVMQGYLDTLLWTSEDVWRLQIRDQSLVALQKNAVKESANVKGERPDCFLLSSQALLSKGEDILSESKLDKALEELKPSRQNGK